MKNNDVLNLCSCCVDSKPLYSREDGRIICLSSGHVYEQRAGNFRDTLIDISDYERNPEYYDLEFPSVARPIIPEGERIDLSRYGYS